MPTNIPAKTTNPGQPNGQLSAAEFNTLNNQVNTNETAAQNAANTATNAANAAATADGKATTALANAATADGKATTALANAATADGKAVAAQAAIDALAPAVATNTAKRGVPDATTPGGVMFNNGATPNVLSYLQVANAYLASPADDALITALGAASWTNNQATVANWAAGRKYKDASYVYEAFSDNTVTRISLTGGGGGGATNLSYTASPTGGVVASDTGTDATLPLATSVNAGLISPANQVKVAAAIPVNVVGLTDGDLFQYDGVSQGFTRVPTEAEPNAVTTFNLNSKSGNVYGYTNPCTAASYTIANAKAGCTAIARIQNSTSGGPSFALSGGTVVKVGDWAAGWSTTGVNQIQIITVTATLAWVYLLGSN